MQVTSQGSKSVQKTSQNAAFNTVQHKRLYTHFQPVQTGSFHTQTHVYTLSVVMVTHFGDDERLAVL